MRKLFLAVLLNLCIFSLFAKNVDLGYIVIGPYGNHGRASIFDLPFGSYVFTEKDIKSSGAGDILGFLKTRALANVSDLTGSGVKANVDLMGFGDNANSNILLVVDGIRMNDIDMSGIDWSQIPLDNVKRIEVLKGTGAVLYGDNTAGGVISIITKQPAGKKTLKSSVSVQGGSYGLDKEKLSFAYSLGSLSLYGYTEHHSLNGYRNNSHYRSKYYNLRGSTDLGKLNVKFGLSSHDYVYGLPGALYESDLSSYTRRDSKYPNDNAHMLDNTASLEIKGDIFSSLQGSLKMFYRNKNGLDNWLSYTPYNSTTDKNIKNFLIRPQVDFLGRFLGSRHNVIAGAEFYWADFTSFTDDLSIFNSDSNTAIDRKYQAFFLQDQWELNSRLSLRLGARMEKDKFTFDYSKGATKVDDDLHFWEEAYEAGINYKFEDDADLYVNFSRGFRVPKTDEYFVSFPAAHVNQDLHTQVSREISWGAKTRLSKRLSGQMDFFLMDISHEIYYDPLTWNNSNYDKTQRSGAGLSLNCQVSKDLAFSAGYRYTHAEFKKGSYNGKTVPGVPKYMLNLSIKYNFLKYFSLYLNSSYKGKSYLINDLSNSYAKAESFWVTNLKLGFKKNNWQVFFGVNNLFNEDYAEYRIVGTGGRALYPSPERNYFAGVDVSF